MGVPRTDRTLARLDRRGFLDSLPSEVSSSSLPRLPLARPLAAGTGAGAGAVPLILVFFSSVPLAIISSPCSAMVGSTGATAGAAVARPLRDTGAVALVEEGLSAATEAVLVDAGFADDAGLAAAFEAGFEERGAEAVW